MNMPVVTIVGRPNVGKSTLFNRLIGSKKAIVDSTPGVTRDKNYAETSWQGVAFKLIDTGGIGYPLEGKLLTLIKKQVESAIKEADLILFLCDGKEGLLWQDTDVARLLLKTHKNTLLVINKIDNVFREDEIVDFYRLGFDAPIPISALHGKNIDTLLDKIIAQILPYQVEEEQISPISVAIVGKPNVGKSSILNAILGQERVIVDETPGTTRDAIDILFKKGKSQFLFIDTAGIRKKSKVKKHLEYYSVVRALKSIKKAEVVLLIIDAIEGISTQDKKIVKHMELAESAGIVVINKWDLLPHKNRKKQEEYEKYIRQKIPYMTYLPVIFTSAITKEGIGKLLKLIEQIHQEYTTWINTSTLNNVVNSVYSKRKPQTIKGKSLKIYYTTQIKTSPPSFLIFVNQPKLASLSYMKYLQNQIRKLLGLKITPIKIKIKKRPH